MSHFRCPVCHGALKDRERSLCCERGHCFDKARSGYVNLLQSQQSSQKRHGDDKRMLKARRAFLDSGYYEPLRNLLCTVIAKETDTAGVLLDAGCGEGYYTARIAQCFEHLTVCGIDISKDALAMAASRSKVPALCVASVFAMPVSDGSVDTVVSVFAPCADSEFARVLKKGGKLVRIIPTERHLFGLKAAVYETPRLNKPERTEVDGFALCQRHEIHSELTLTDRTAIRALFEMTPYFYKTGQEDQERLLSRDTLCTKIGFAVLLYEKL